MARSRVELMGLEFEAERLVRAGESRAQVSRVLGVSVQTLAGWALRGGWRKKDIELEKSGAITRRVIRNVAAGHAWEAARRSIEAEQVWVMREAGAVAAAGDGAGLARLMAMAPEGMRARPLLEAEAVVEAGPGLGARHGAVGAEGVVSEEDLLAGDGWDESAVAD